LAGIGANQLTNFSLSEVRMAGFSLSQILGKRPQDAKVTDSDNSSASDLVVEATSRPAVGSSFGAAAHQANTVVPDEVMPRVQRLAGVGTLTAGVTEELANPIGFVTAICANLLDRLGSEDIDSRELIQAIKQIEQNAYRSARIVEVLGNYANDKGDESTVARGAGVSITSPAAVLQDALILVEQQFRKQSGILVETELEPGLTTIFAEHNALTQLLVNLLINARDAMQPDGGTIRVRFWVPDLALEWLPGLSQAGKSNSPSADLTRDLFAFSVKDSGQGIDGHILERIFDPFFTTRKDGHHAGLGLAIARMIVERHQGWIWAANNPGGGAIVTVVMPRRITNDE
jgi:signal transduction histidine kinase